MKIERSKDWWLNQARHEGDAAVGAGLLALDPQTEEHAASPVGEGRIAFGRLVNLMRRRQRLSIEKLAELAEIDLGELVSIEDDLQYTPEPRTIFQLARTFELPQRRLMQLAGLIVATDSGFRQEVVRFAARSEPVQKLTTEENAALEAFIGVLSEQQKSTKSP